MEKQRDLHFTPSLNSNAVLCATTCQSCVYMLSLLQYNDWKLGSRLCIKQRKQPLIQSLRTLAFRWRKTLSREFPFPGLEPSVHLCFITQQKLSSNYSTCCQKSIFYLSHINFLLYSHRKKSLQVIIIWHLTVKKIVLLKRKTICDNIRFVWEVSTFSPLSLKSSNQNILLLKV